jgi:hypothetical protein
MELREILAGIKAVGSIDKELMEVDIEIDGSTEALDKSIF